MTKKNRGEIYNFHGAVVPFTIVPVPSPDKQKTQFDKYYHRSIERQYEMKVTQMLDEICARDDWIILNGGIWFTHDHDAIMFKLRASDIEL